MCNDRTGINIYRECFGTPIFIKADKTVLQAEKYLFVILKLYVIYK